MADLYENMLRQREQYGSGLLRESKRTHFWRAALVGILAGICAVLFQLALDGATSLREALVQLMQQVGQYRVITTTIFCATAAGAAGYLTSNYCPEAAGSGIPHLKAVLMNLRQFRWLAVAVTKFVGGFLAIAAGLSLGREGPTVHIGAAIGKGVSEKLRIPKRSYRTLIASGAGAGLSAAFNAPLAGFLFVLELQRELSPTTYGTALIASVSADAVTRAFLGQRTAFRIIGYDAPSMKLLPWILLLGLLAGILGVVFNRCLLWGSGIMAKFPWWKAAVVGAIAGVAVWYLPEITGGGHGTAELVLSGEFKEAGAMGILALLLVAKLVFTVLSYGAGVPGGIFAPILVMGAFGGLLAGKLFSIVMPGLQINPAAFAVLGMAALLSASIRAPLTGVVLIVEMTGNYEQLYALIVASLSAYLVAEALRNPPIYEAMLERDLAGPDPAAHGMAEPVLTEVYVEYGSYLANRQVEAMDLPEGCILLSILRGRNEIVPSPGFHLKPGDILVFLLETPDSRLAHAVTRLARS